MQCIMRNMTVVAAAAFTMVSMPGQSKELTIDAGGIMKLSEAVADVYAADDGPDIINIMVDSLPMDDVEIVLDKPITINGDADGNGIKCDILVDIQAIKDAPTVGIDARCYLEIESPGDVTIRDLKIHPNMDNDVAGGGNPLTLVDAIRINRQADSSSFPTHSLIGVWVSGSDQNDNYIPLDNADDLYNMPGVKRWSRQSGSSAHGVIHVSKDATLGEGDYNAILDNCHAGLGMGDALNIPAERGHVTVIGGIYGHSGKNGIRVSGDVVTLTGSPTNRLRIVNVPNINASNSHGIFNATATFDKVEWVDIATINTGRNVQVNGGIPMPMTNCRLMGKLTPTANAILFHTHPTSTVLMEDCTLIGAGNNYNPHEVKADTQADNVFRNCIFASEGFGQIMNRNEDNIGSQTFINCAIPTDGLPGESLNVLEPIMLAPGVSPPNYSETDTVNVSPEFMLTVTDYDWSEAQGANDPANGAGNANVYRPSSPAYIGASSDGSDLVGGAGDALSRIDASLWMLM